MKAEWGYDIIAPFYDQDMGLNMPCDDLGGYLRLLPRPPANLLEIGCGTGRLTLALADCGFSITAIDRSAPMLEQLRNKMRPEQTIDVRLLDARQINLDGPYDVILFSYSGFQYLLGESDIDRFCRQARGVLAPSGSLILDIFLHQAGSETSGFVRDYERTLADGRLLRRWKKLSVSDGVNCVERKYQLTGTGEVQEFRTKSRQRLYTPQTLVAEMRKHGFVLDTCIFDYHSHSGSSIDNPRFFTARFTPAAVDVPPDERFVVFF
jgi:ubiquinone/menaquinone biosynthesis C-methylase UbiE